MKAAQLTPAAVTPQGEYLFEQSQVEAALTAAYNEGLRDGRRTYHPGAVEDANWSELPESD